MTTKKTETTQPQHQSDQAQHEADGSAPPFGRQPWGPAFDSAQAMWKQLIDTQVQAFESAVTQAERLTQRQMSRLQEGLDETTRLTRSAFAWMTEVQAEVGKAAVEAVRAAAARAQRRAA